MKKGLMMEKQNTCAPNKTPSSSSSLSSLSMHKNSHTISKPKPKIRIIHIFAPQIIKTDAKNFRELVQRLTGKPTTTHDQTNCTNHKKSTVPTIKKLEPIRVYEEMELRNSTIFNEESECASAVFRERIKGEEEIWEGANTGGGFLGGFADIHQFDGFNFMLQDEQQQLNHFPFSEGTTHDAYGESQIIAN